MYYVLGLALVIHYRWIMDDAFVYFRYVDNLLFLNAGLTYNQGEFVEGFTSPLHCLLLIAARSTEMSYPAIIYGLGAACWTAFWALLVGLNRALSPRGERIAVFNLPLAYLCTNYAVTSYFTSGLESPLALIAGAVYAFSFLRPTSKRWSIGLAFTPLVRPELAAAALLATGYAWWRNRRVPRFLVITLLLANVPWLLFRVWYYADLLPNTFYLKDVDHWDWGWSFLADATMSYRFPAFAALAAAASILVLRREVRAGRSLDGLVLPARGAMLVTAAVLTSYVVKIGGGFIHLYYLWTPCVLAVVAWGGILERLLVGADRRRIVLAHVGVIGVSAFVATCYSTVLPERPFRALKRQVDGALIEDPVHHRTRPLSWSYVPIDRQREFAPVLATAGYDSVRADGFCSIIYNQFRFRSIHRYGLTDAFLARTIAAERRKGHKPTLRPLARDLQRLAISAPSIDAAMFRDAVAEGRAPAWIEQNLDSIDLIARKVYNHHRFFENLALALTHVEPIDPGEVVFVPHEEGPPEIPSLLKPGTSGSKQKAKEPSSGP
jgi:hypothetical protein